MKITKEQLEQDIFENKLTYKSIAEKHNVSLSTVNWYVRKYEIATLTKTKVYPTKDELYDLYYVQRKPVREILKIFSMGKTTLEKLFKDYGLVFRPLGTNQSRSWTYNEVKKYFSDNGCELLSTEYINNSTPLEYRCNCGNVSKIRFSAFQRGQRCKKCAVKKIAEKNRLTYDEVKNIFEEKGAILLSKEYTNAQTPLEYICPKCGERAFMSLNNFQKGYSCSNCKRLRFKGANNPHYNPLISDYDRQELGRYEERYRAFRRAVFARDRQCVICGANKNKIVHHLDGYSENPEKRTDINNAVTLCEKCHKKFHSKYGYGGNTKEQFNEFRKACK